MTADESPQAAAPGASDRALRIVVPRYGTSVVGGAEAAMRALGHALSNRGWDISVWTTTALDEATWRQGFAPGVEHDGDIVVRRFPVVMSRHPWLFAQLSHGAYHLPRGLRAEHVWAIAQGPYAPSLVRALAGAAATPTVFSPYLFHPTLFGLPAAPHPRILVPAAHDEPALRLRVARRAILSADALWFHSEEERDLLISMHPEARTLPSRCGVVGIEAPTDLDGRAFAKRHAIDGPYLYYGGRTAGGKGLADLLEGMALLHAADPTTRLVLSGDPAKSAYPAWVRHLGRLDERQRWEAIAGAAAVVVPGALESLSLLALEAWAMGRPCLLNAASPVLAGHAARSRGGLTYTGARDLAGRAAQLIDSPERAGEMGAAGRAYVTTTYRWDLAEQRLQSLLMEARR
jgi:glycosyltransferase involved in cell wall biosynthesis